MQLVSAECYLRQLFDEYRLRDSRCVGVPHWGTVRAVPVHGGVGSPGKVSSRGRGSSGEGEDQPFGPSP